MFAGAKARIEEVDSNHAFTSRLRQRMINDGTLANPDELSYTLTADTLFTSPSSASAALLGRTSNGRVEWKDAEGVTLKDHQLNAALQAGE